MANRELAKCGSRAAIMKVHSGSVSYTGHNFIARENLPCLSGYKYRTSNTWVYDTWMQMGAGELTQEVLR